MCTHAIDDKSAHAHMIPSPCECHSSLGQAWGTQSGGCTSLRGQMAPTPLLLIEAGSALQLTWDWSVMTAFHVYEGRHSSGGTVKTLLASALDPPNPTRGCDRVGCQLLGY